MIQLVLFMQLQTALPQIGLASMYHPESEQLACDGKRYSKRYPVCASRELPCGTILNIQREDNGKITQCVVADRGPYGACVESNKKRSKNRACGEGKKWVNGGKWVRKGQFVDPKIWRGILDLAPLAARRLGFQNRLVKVVIWAFGTEKPDYANFPDIDKYKNVKLPKDDDEDDDPKIDNNNDEEKIVASNNM